MSEKIEFTTVIKKRNKITIPKPFKTNDAIKVTVTKLIDPELINELGEIE